MPPQAWRMLFIFEPGLERVRGSASGIKFPQFFVSVLISREKTHRFFFLDSFARCVAAYVSMSKRLDSLQVALEQQIDQ